MLLWLDAAVFRLVVVECGGYVVGSLLVNVVRMNEAGHCAIASELWSSWRPGEKEVAILCQHKHNMSALTLHTTLMRLVSSCLDSISTKRDVFSHISLARRMCASYEPPLVKHTIQANTELVAYKVRPPHK